MKEQKNFEKNVFNKTHKADSKFLFFLERLLDLTLPLYCAELSHTSPMSSAARSAMQ